MNWPNAIIPLREVLAALYPRVEESRPVVADSDIDDNLITYDANARANWQNILEKALVLGKVDKLIEQVQGDAQQSPDFQKAVRIWREYEESDAGKIFRIDNEKNKKQEEKANASYESAIWSDAFEKEFLFVGRKQELEIMHKQIEYCFNKKKPRLLLIEGDYGVGKTALIRKFLEQISASNKSLEIFVSKCAIENNKTGLLPFRYIFSQIVRRLVGPEDIVRDYAPAWVQMIGLGNEEPIGSVTFTQENIFSQFVWILKKVSESRQIIILIEDIHWIDEESLHLLSFLLSNLREGSVFLVCSYRPIIEEINKSELFYHLHPELVRYGTVLDVVTGIEVDDYVQTRYPNNQFRLDLIRTIQDLTGGHPLFIQQLFEYWEADQKIRQIQTNEQFIWVSSVDINSDLEIPRSLAEVLQLRINMIGNELKRILTSASVEGDNFTVQVVAQLAEISDMDTCSKLIILDNQYRFVKELSSQKIENIILDFYRFRHRFFREHIHKNLNSIEKRLLHQKVGEILEFLYSNPKPVASQLARHFIESDDYDKAVKYSLIAGQMAVETCNWLEGTNRMKETLAFIETMPESDNTFKQEIKAILIWEKCAELTGDTDELFPRLEKVLEKAKNKPEFLLLYYQLRVALSTLAYLSAVEVDIEDLRAAINFFKQEKNYLDEYNANRILANVLVDERCKYKQGLNIWNNVLEIAQLLNDKIKIADTFAHMGWANIKLGNNIIAMTLLKNGLRVLDNKNTDLQTYTFLIRCIGYAQYEKGSYRKALSAQKFAFKAVHNMGDQIEQSFIYLELADTYTALSEYDRALDCINQCKKYAKKTNNIQTLTWCHIGLAKLEIQRENSELCYLQLREADRLISEYGSSKDEFEIMLLNVECNLKQRRIMEAARLLEKAQNLSKNIESDVPQLLLFYFWGDLYALKLDWTSAIDFYEKSLNISKMLGIDTWIAINNERIGNIYLEMKEIGKAKDYLKESLFIYKNLYNSRAINFIEDKIKKY